MNMRTNVFHLTIVALLAAIISFSSRAVADSVVPMHLNGWIHRSDDVSNFDHQDFTYDGIVVSAPTSVPEFEGFFFDDENMGGGGAGYNAINNLNAPTDASTELPIEPLDFGIAGTFDILDRGSFGANFTPSDYVVEVIYKPGPENTSTDINVMVEQWDGFVTEAGENFGMRRAEQLQWGSDQALNNPDMDIVSYYNNNPQDADGFATLRIPLSNAPQFTGQSYMFNDGDASFAAAGDATADLDNFEGGVPNGIGQMHLQAPYESVRLDIEVKDVRIVPTLRNPTIIAQYDSRSGVSRRFGTPFNTDNGAGEFIEFDHDDNPGTTDVFVTLTDQIQRFDENGFTNLIIQTDDSLELGGFGMWQDHLYQTFDGTQATLEVTARRTDHNQADFVDIVLNDLDGDDSAEGMGGEEYKYEVDLNAFSTTEMSTVSIPLTDFTERQAAVETFFDGDMSLEDFNLYYLGFLTREAESDGLVGLEVENVRVTLPAPQANADFDGDGDVDGSDFLAWQRNAGSANGLRPVLDAGDADYDGDVDADDLAVWNAQYGNIQAVALTNVPEPGALVLSVLGMLCAGGFRTGRNRG